MKTSRHCFLSLLAFLGLVAVSYGASLPAVDVKISTGSGKVVFEGKTKSDGTFAAPNLAAGPYVILFKSKAPLKGGPFSLVLKMGKQTSSASSLPGAQFSSGGVGMKVSAEGQVNLTGQLSRGAAAPAPAVAAANPKDEGKVKYVNGHKFIYIPREPGGYTPGRWVDAESKEAQNLIKVQEAGAQKPADQ